MDVTLPDGTTLQGVPDGTTRAQIADKLRRGGRQVPDSWTAPVDQSTLLPGQVPQPKPKKEDGTMEALIGGGLEAGASIASSIPARLVGNAAGAVRRFLPGGDMDKAGKTAGEISESLTYMPRGERGKRALEIIGQGMADSKIEGLNPAMGMEVSAPGAAARGMRNTVRNVVDELPVGDLPKSRTAAPAAPQMAGGGAAETAIERIRRERASGLPVPIKLSKGQASRDFEQQRFERETSKDAKLGQPIRDRYAQQNEQILQNFDAWVDQTGAQAPSLRATGKAVDRALVQDAERAKAKTNAAYAKARAAGEMEAPVSTDGLVAYIEKNRPAAINAPVLTSIEQKLVQLGGATRDEAGRLIPGKISINDMEELRQFIGATSDSTPTNMRFGAQAKEAIDAATEGAGGTLYKEARAQRKNYARKFEDHAVVSKLLRTKTGTKDRAVALEDVFKHSVLDSSLDDLQSLGRTVKAAGKEGREAWREIQGQTIAYIRDDATKGITRDSRGNPIASPSSINKSIRELDRDGKLDYLFGKANAQQLRDIADIAIDVHTAPPGSVNSSGTVSVLLGALREIGTGHLSVGTARAIGVLKKELGSRATKKRVRDALADPAEALQ